MTTGRVQIMVRTEDHSPNMPSLTRMLEILKPRTDMDATVPTGSVRITGYPVMGPHDDCCGCGCEGCNDGDLQDD